jgi:hypothetical protein
MTRKLEELFDLPPTTDEVDAAIPALPASRETLQALDQAIDKIDNALPAVRGLESTDVEMDELAGLATGSYKDLMDLGMQVDSRFASEIFSVASNMLGHAITAKTAKLDKKLKMIDLQLKKMRLDQTAKPEDDSNDGTVQTAQGVVLSRNDLLERIVGRKDQNSQKE